MRLTNLTHEDWLGHAFGHEVRIQQAAWFFDHDCDWWEPEPAVAVAYLTRLFEHPEPALRWYPDSQIAQGLIYLVSTSATGDNGWLYSTEVPIADRVRCVEAVGSLFAQLFVPRCTPHLSHLSETEAGSLNGVCYMWWDGFPCLALAGDPDLSRMQETALGTMARSLGFDSLACQESALHGLGHWQRGHERSERDHRRLPRSPAGPRPAPRRLREHGPLRLRALGSGYTHSTTPGASLGNGLNPNRVTPREKMNVLAILDFTRLRV